MKPILTLAIAFIVSVSAAQTKKDTSFFGTHAMHEVIAPRTTVEIVNTEATHTDLAIHSLKVAGFHWFNTPSEVMSISAPDSTGTITVRFSRKAVKFTSDSTFTFKQPK